MYQDEKKLLFESLSKILSNQDSIMKHFGLNKYSCEWGWDDNETDSLSGECWEIAQRYNN